MYDEVSAGAVVYYGEGDGVEYLLLHYPAGHWNLCLTLCAKYTELYISIYPFCQFYSGHISRL